MNDSDAQSAGPDEAFWQAQEERRSVALGQPCCTLSGMCTILAGMAGRFAVVIHAERDCANCFHHHLGPAVADFYCTGLGDVQVTTGRTDEPLRRCLQLVVEERGPEAVLVLGSCLVEMIGDRFENVVEEVAASSGVPMVALRTSGLALGSQADMLDWLFDTLAGLPVPGKPGSGEGFNLVGLPDIPLAHAELDSVLAAAGLGPARRVPYGACLDDWLGMRRADVTFVVDRQLYPRLLARLEDGGQTVVEVPLPTGVQQTERFYAIIGEHFGAADRVETAMATARASARGSLEEFRRRRGGLRVAMGLRMLNDYRTDQLAYAGLGDAVALTEMGFDLQLLVQGPPDEQAREQFAQLLSRLGCDLPFEVFPDPWSLGDRLAGKGFDLAYLADHSREEARRAGLPMIDSRGLKPFFAGVRGNLSLMERLLRERLGDGE